MSGDPGTRPPGEELAAPQPPPAPADPRELLDLSGKVALVSGGTRNIGREVAQILAAAGADVGVVGRSDAKARDATVGAIEARGRRAVGTLADVADPAQVTAAVDTVEQALGTVDVFVNCAAVRPTGALQDITVADWDAVMHVNLRAPFLFAQRLLPGMKARGYGRIIAFGGLSMLWGKPDRAHVTASKAGLMGLTLALAAECATDGVTVNAVVPGVIDTQRANLDWYPDLGEFYARRLSRIPMARLGRPDELASVTLFLASDMSRYMTGQTLYVTGGAHPMVRGA